MTKPADMLRLGVNIDHVATLRNARGGSHPCPVSAALLRRSLALMVSQPTCAKTVAILRMMILST